MNFKELFVDKSNLLIVNTKLAVILGVRETLARQRYTFPLRTS